MTVAANTQVSWLLLSYIVLLGVGGIGLWVTVNNFGIEVSPQPTPPTQSTITTPRPGSSSSRFYGMQSSYLEAFSKYVQLTERYAGKLHDPRVCVGVPCGVSVMVAASMVVAGLCSRKLFTTTFSLYSSLGLCVLDLWLTCTCHYTPHVDTTVTWVMGFQYGLLLLLLLQVLLSVWELRRQEVDWPTINLSSLFTADALLLAARLTLVALTVVALTGSPVVIGVDGYTVIRHWGTPKVSYPLYLALPILAAAFYGVVATAETTCSYFFGILHNHLTLLTSLVSTCCFVTVAVLSSPVAVRTALGPFWMDPLVMNFGIATSIISFVHALCCLFFSSACRKTPTVIRKTIDTVAWNAFLPNNIMTDGPKLKKSTTHRKVWNAKSFLSKNFEYNSLGYNLLSSVFSVITPLVAISGWDDPLFSAWGSVVLLCVDFTVLTQAVPHLMIELYGGLLADIPEEEAVMTLLLEIIALLVGSLATLTSVRSGTLIAAAVMNLLYFTFQTVIITTLILGNETPEPEIKRLTAVGSEKSTEMEPKKSGLQEENKQVLFLTALA